MNEQEIRLECLKLALQNESHPEFVVKSAREYADFVLGTNDSEVIAAARILAEKVK